MNKNNMLFTIFFFSMLLKVRMIGITSMFVFFITFTTKESHLIPLLYTLNNDFLQVIHHLIIHLLSDMCIDLQRSLMICMADTLHDCFKAHIKRCQHADMCMSQCVSFYPLIQATPVTGFF